MAYDAVVIGAGHNGLAAAVHLAGKGWTVAVVEPSREPGGAVKTREMTLPGFRHDLCAMNLSMFAGSAFFAAHKEALIAHGLAFAPAEHCFATRVSATALVSASAAISRRRVAGIAALSPTDAERWRAMLGALRRRRAAYFRPARLADALVRGGAGCVWKAWRERGTAGCSRRCGCCWPRRAIFSTRISRTPKLKAMMAAWGLHLDFAPDVAGGALFPYLECMANQGFGMVIGAGGADTIITAMTRRLKAKGGEVLLGDAGRTASRPRAALRPAWRSPTASGSRRRARSSPTRIRSSCSAAWSPDARRAAFDAASPSSAPGRPR